MLPHLQKFVEGCLLRFYVYDAFLAKQSLMLYGLELFSASNSRLLTIIKASQASSTLSNATKPSIEYYVTISLSIICIFLFFYLHMFNPNG